MSFAGETKGELCRTALNRKCCTQAEAYGVLLYCNTFSGREIRIITENEAFAQRLPILFRKAFRLSFDRLPDGEGKYSFGITDPAKLAAVSGTFGMDAGSLANHVNFAVLEEPCCRAAFLRGAFLAGGSVTDPRKAYHLELSTSHYNVSREVPALMREAGFQPKEATRKANYIAYFKQSERIEDFLTAIGAPLAAMEIMNAKLEKNLRGSVNRRVNCDAANLDKAVEAAQVQLTIRDTPEPALKLVPRIVWAGIGCRRGVPAERLEAALRSGLEAAGLHPAALAGVCTIDRKGEEPGLLELCRRRRLPLLTYSPEELSRAEGEFTPSPFVRQVTGTDNVCERAAVLASGGPLLLKKTAGEGVTAALAAAPFAPGWEEAP